MKILIIVGSVRPGRVGLPVAEWVRSEVLAHDEFDEIDFADLAELALPLMDEPNHPAKREYTKPHTFAWSERVDAADAIILVSPEYNHSYSPALKNAIDYLSQEWRHKPVSIVSYGGVSGGTRGATALEPVLTTVGLVKVPANVEINFVSSHVSDGVFTPEQRHLSVMGSSLNELAAYSRALAPLRS